MGEPEKRARQAIVRFTEACREIGCAAGEASLAMQGFARAAAAHDPDAQRQLDQLGRVIEPRRRIARRPAPPGPQAHP